MRAFNLFHSTLASFKDLLQSIHNYVIVSIHLSCYLYVVFVGDVYILSVFPVNLK